jgi:tight adherence protein C
MSHDMLFILCMTGAVAAVAYLAAQLFLGDGSTKLRQRLLSRQQADDEAAKEQRQQQQQANRMVPALQKLGRAAAAPLMPKTREKQSVLRKNLAMAGMYAPESVRTVAGFKLILMVLGVLLGYVAGLLTDNLLLGLSIGGLIGYLAPLIWLKTKISQNQQALSRGLPDALDLLVVCVEAGLTVDAAMQRVSQELALAHPALARELGITHMETQVGLSRIEAVRNLGTRTNNPALQALTAMLVQADRFGTSIADALRIQAESLRLSRHYAAEEVAAKAAVKMSFPLVLFIFPSTFIVLAGPTVIQLMQSPLFN